MYKPKPISRFESKLVAVVDLTPNDREFTFTVPADFDFTCGQFLSFLFEKDGKPLRRPYSICSSPFELEGETVVRFAITKVENGPGTTMLWNMVVGDTLKMMGPMGVFVLKEEYKENGIIFIGTGTGTAPFRSMIRQLLHEGYEKPLTLYAGFRYVKTRLYHDEYLELAEKYPNFTYLSAISQAETEHEHENGRVTQLVNDHISGDEKQQIFLCGLYPMIKDVGVILSAKGIPKEQIHFERYD